MKEQNRLSNEDYNESDDDNDNNSNNSLFMYVLNEQPNGQVEGENKIQIKTRAKPKTEKEASIASKARDQS
jgi:hypothetical protein